jgi:hypothetical protein
MLAWATVQELLHAEGIRRLDTPEARIVCMAFEHHRLKLPMGFQTRSQLAKWVTDETAMRKAKGLL